MTKDLPTWKQAYSGGNMTLRPDARLKDDVLIGALSTEWVGSTTSADRVLVFSSNYDASVEISLVRPARHKPEDICLAVIDDARVKALTTDGLATLFDLMKPTHVIFCRYWGGNYDQIVELARLHGSALLSFLDDNLLDVPPETGQSTYDFFQDEARRQVITRTIAEADLFIPSTPFLAEVMQAYRPGPMAEWPIYRSIESSEFEPRLPRRMTPTIGYMGSGSHITDVELVLPAITALLEKRPDVRVEFFGTIKPPPSLAVFGDRVAARTKADSYDDFINRLKKLGWWVGLAPLAASDFNKTKASTKWVEYTLAGIATLATSEAVYGKPHRAGALELADPAGYLSAIEHLLDDEARREALLETSRNLLLQAYNLSDHSLALKQALLLGTQLAQTRKETATAALQNQPEPDVATEDMTKNKTVVNS